VKSVQTVMAERGLDPRVESANIEAWDAKFGMGAMGLGGGGDPFGGFSATGESVKREIGPPPFEGAVFDKNKHRWVKIDADDEGRDVQSKILPREDGTDHGYVWRVQPVGSDLHGQQSTTSNDDTIDGVFVFDNLNELTAIDWMNEKNVELVKIAIDDGDTFTTSDQEGIGLKSGRGKVVAAMPFDDIRSVRRWATDAQKNGWKPVKNESYTQDEYDALSEADAGGDGADTDTE